MLFNNLLLASPSHHHPLPRLQKITQHVCSQPRGVFPLLEQRLKGSSQVPQSDRHTHRKRGIPPRGRIERISLLLGSSPCSSKAIDTLKKEATGLGGTPNQTFSFPSVVGPSRCMHQAAAVITPRGQFCASYSVLLLLLLLSWNRKTRTGDNPLCTYTRNAAS